MYHSSAMAHAYKPIFDIAINRARREGYRIKDTQFFDSYTRECDPVGAMWAFNYCPMPKEYIDVFTTGFLGQSKPQTNYSEANEAFQLGFYYRNKFILGKKNLY